MEAATEYNKVLCDKIRPYLHTNGGPVILVGLENEYGSFGDDREYLQMLDRIEKGGTEYRRQAETYRGFSFGGSPFSSLCLCYLCQLFCCRGGFFCC